MGKSCNELKARRVVDETVRKIDRVYHKLHELSKIAVVECQKPCRSKAVNATSRFCCWWLVWVYVGIFAIFVSIDGRAELPTVKFQQILWSPGYASVFETSWFITNSFLSFPFLFHLLLEGSQLKDSCGLNDLVAIKDLLWHLCILWYLCLNVKGFYVRMHSSSVCRKSDVCDRP